MKTKYLIVGAMLVVLPLLYNNCGQSTISASKMLRTSASDDINVVTTNQAPRINCNIERASDSHIFKSLSAVSSGDVSYGDPTDVDDLRFNCAATTDESPTSSLTFLIDIDYDAGSPNFVPLTGNLRFDATLRRTMAIRAIDPQGRSADKAFNLEVDCANATAPDVSNAAINVVAGARVNHFAVSVGGVSDASGTQLQYAYDFNGDGDFDPLDRRSFNVWTNLTSLPDVYIANGGTNYQVKARVKNGCGVEADIVSRVNIDVQTFADAEPSSPQDHWLIEGDISGINTANAQRANNETGVSMYPDERDDDLMDCDYNRNGAVATFAISGKNYYQDESDYTGSEGVYKHGLSLSVQNIPDTGANGLQSFTEANGISVRNAQYSVSTVDETPAQALLNENYNKNGDCDVTLNMVRATAVTPCNDGSSVESVAIQIYGEYSCPQMRSTSGRTISVNNGKYFCEWAMADSCVGGGGGGGGEPPPPQ